MESINFELAVTRAQLRAALIFAGDKDIRYYLNGVCLHVGECGDARLVATDGSRLAIIKLDDASGATPGEYIIPRDVLKTIKKACRYDFPLTLKISGAEFQIVDPAGSQILGGSKLIDGKFPDFQRVIPQPENMDGTPGAFNASYLADIQKALIELGDKNGFFPMLQNGEKSGALVVREDKGFLCVVMGMRGFDQPSAPDVAQFMPRVMPRAVVETAAGGQAFPCDALQDVTDKRRQALPAPPAVVMVDIDAPAVVAHCGADMAAWIDPSGALQAAGLLIVAHVGDAPQKETRPRSIVSTLETATTNHGSRPLMLQYRTAGMAPAGAGESFAGEAWGSIIDVDGFVTAGTWHKTEDEARATVGTPDRAEKIQTVERRDGTGRAWLALAGVPKGCDSLHPLQYRALGVAQARAAKLRGAGIAATVCGRGPFMIKVDPSGEVVADVCPTLLPGRWIPGGAENAERIAFDAALGAEVWLISSSARPGALAVIAYAGKRTKHDAHYTMRDRAQALTWAGEYMGKQQAAAQRQTDRRAEKAAKRAAGHKLKAGDVLRCSWGYDQTNIDYYEVTRLIGARMVEIRKIGAESVNDGGLSMTGDCVPRPGHYIGEPMRKAVSDYDGQSVRIASYAHASKIEPREVAGVKLYPVDHWTAYA